MRRRARWMAMAAIAAAMPLIGAAHWFPAHAAAGLQSYGADAAGSAVHVIAGSNAFPNFRTGAVDNSYPLATVHMDASPAAQATASVADTGPMGGTGVAALNDQLRANGAPIQGATQPQYAVANFPGAGHSSLTQGPVVAESNASDAKADSRSAILAVGSGGPGAVEQPNDPAHTSGIDGEAKTAIENAVVVSTGYSHVDRATFAGGVLVLSNIDVTASVTSNGATATPTASVSIGRVTVNGVSVTITDKGVVVNGAPQGGSDAAISTLNAQLNSALSAQGLHVFVVAPDVHRDGVAASAFASGVHVTYQEPVVDPSVPAQFLEYTFGEARAFAFAVRDVSLDAPVVDDNSSNSVADVIAPTVEAAQFTNTDFGTSTLPASATVNVSPSSARGSTQAPATQPAVAVKLPKPTWLAVLFLIWLWFMVATAGVVVWWRRGDRAWEALS